MAIDRAWKGDAPWLASVVVLAPAKIRQIGRITRRLVRRRRLCRVASDDLFTDYRAEIERLLGLAKELSPAMQNRIRRAVIRRHDDAKAREQIDGTDAEDTGKLLLAQLDAADGELEPVRVYELLVLIDVGLARTGST